MWAAQTRQFNNGQTSIISITQYSSPISYGTVIYGWQYEQDFRDFFIDLTSTIPFASFRWETPAITKKSTGQPFECAVIPNPGLARNPDQQTFRQHFQVDQPTVTFPNLGQDAVLVVPCPLRPSDDYSHLGAFIRNAPKSQQHELWKAVGNAMANRLDNSAVWLSTAGGGVAWLHVRLDNTPKYYHYLPYRSAP